MALAEGASESGASPCLPRRDAAGRLPMAVPGPRRAGRARPGRRRNAAAAAAGMCMQMRWMLISC